jgi:hypothetical protein
MTLPPGSAESLSSHTASDLGAVLLSDVFGLSVSGLGGKGVFHLFHFPSGKLMLQGFTYDIPDRSGDHAQPCHLADRLKRLERKFILLFPGDLAALLLESFRHPGHILLLDTRRQPFGDSPSQHLLLFFVSGNGPRLPECKGVSGTDHLHRLYGPFGRYPFCNPFIDFVYHGLYRQPFLPGSHDDLVRPHYQTLAEAVFFHPRRKRDGLIRIDSGTDHLCGADPDPLRCSSGQSAVHIGSESHGPHQKQKNRYYCNHSPHSLTPFTPFYY